MVTNKALTIRLGHTHPWASSNLAQNWYQYHLNLRLKAFLEKFFGDKFFQNRGVSFSHVIPKFSSSHVNLEVFLHDSKLYDFFATKPSRRALKLFRSKKKFKFLFRKVSLFKRYLRRRQKIRRTRFHFSKFKRGMQSRFPVSATSRFSESSSTNYSKFSSQTLESKFKKNRYFKLKFKNVRKFVKVSRKLRRRFFKNKFKFFKPVKIKKSRRNFANSKFNFILNRRKYLSSIFMIRRRFKRKKFKRRRFKKFFFRRRRLWGFRYRRHKYRLRLASFKRRQYRQRTSLNRFAVKKRYSRKLIKISRKFSKRFSTKLKGVKIRFLKFYLKNYPNLPVGADKVASSLKSYYFKKKYAIFNNLRNKKRLNSRKLRKSRLGRTFFRLYSFRRKSKKKKTTN